MTHFSTNVGKRETGQSARAKYEYNNREGKYADQPDKLTYAESENMPAWAQDRPLDYWIAADEYERENGRLYVNAEFALPRDLSAQYQVELAREQCRAMSRTIDGNPLPYSMAIHDGNGHNPHFHIEISERILDGNNRTPETWFKRHPIGAEKSVDLQARDWIPHTRREWCERANKYLEAAGSESRLDHRTLKEQGEDRIATIHVGYTDPAKPHIRRERLERNEAIKLANRLPEASRAVAQADERIAKAEAAIAELNATLREIEGKAAAETAAASMPGPDASRQAHDLAQLGPKGQTQEKTEQTPQKSAGIQASPEQTHEKSTQTQEKTGQTQKITEPQTAKVSVSEIHAPEPLTREERAQLDRDNPTYPLLAERYANLQAAAAQPAPTFDTILAKQPEWQKTQDAAQDAETRLQKRLESDRTRRMVNDLAGEQRSLEKDRKAHAERFAGASYYRRGEYAVGRGPLFDEAKALDQRGAELAQGLRFEQEHKAETLKLQLAATEANKAVDALRSRELEPGSATQKQLAMEQNRHRQSVIMSARLAPYVAERAQQHEAEKGQGKTGASLDVEQGQGRGLELVHPVHNKNSDYYRAGEKTVTGKTLTPQAAKHLQETADKQAANAAEAELLKNKTPAEQREYRRKKAKEQGGFER